MAGSMTEQMGSARRADVRSSFLPLLSVPTPPWQKGVIRDVTFDLPTPGDSSPPHHRKKKKTVQSHFTLIY